MQGIQPIGEGRGPRLQDNGRFDLVKFCVAYGGDVRPAQARGYAFRAELLAAPRADDDIRSAAHNLLLIGDDATLGKAARGSLRKYVDATGDVDAAKFVMNRPSFRNSWWTSAAKAWRFTPATKDGKPVRFVMRIVMDDSANQR